MLIDVWDFTLPPDDPRRANLQAEGSFDAVAEDIRQKMEVLCCHPDPCGKIPPFKRVVYCIRVPTPVFDRFFNSQYGYRGAYFRSPFDGLSANDHLLRTLTPALMESPETRAGDAQALSPEFIKESLSALSAKAWLTEPKEYQFIKSTPCKRCKSDWKSDEVTAQVINGRWEDVKTLNGSTLIAKYGRSAPYLTKIRVMGGFLDDNHHHEVIPEDKRRRHCEIHKTGWS